MMRNTREAAKGRWPGVLAALGVDKRFLRRNVHQECPLCGGTDRYRFDDKNGEGMYYCNACGAGDGMTLLMGYSGMDFREAANAVDEVVGNVELAPVNEPPKKDPKIRLRKVAQSLVPLTGSDPVSLYMHSRGIEPAPCTQYSPSLPYYEGGQFAGNYPAMVHLFRGPDGSPRTYHITYLTEGGQKAPVQAAKKILPATGDMKGGAIRLHPITNSVVGIAEGIETAQAANKAFPELPVWAAYSATLLEQFQPPEGTNVVLIFGDSDHSYTGQAASYALAKRLVREGYVVRVKLPAKIGTDFADEAGHGN